MKKQNKNNTDNGLSAETIYLRNIAKTPKIDECDERRIVGELTAVHDNLASYLVTTELQVFPYSATGVYSRRTGMYLLVPHYLSYRGTSKTRLFSKEQIKNFESDGFGSLPEKHPYRRLMEALIGDEKSEEVYRGFFNEIPPIVIRKAASDLRSVIQDGDYSEFKSVKDGIEENLYMYRGIKSKLIEGNLHLVVPLAHGRRRRGLSLLDAIQEGNLGLERAVELYDHRSGLRFLTYAEHRIRGNMIRGSKDQSGTIRVPNDRSIKYNKIKRVKKELSEELRRDPSEQEVAIRSLEHQIAKKLKRDRKKSDTFEGLIGKLKESGSNLNGFEGSLSEVIAKECKIIETVLLEMPKTSSIHAQSNEDGEDYSELLEDEKFSVDLEESFLRQERFALRADLQLLMGESKLTKRQRDALLRKIGFSGKKESFVDIASSWGISRQAVEQNYYKALRKLRNKINRDGKGAEYRERLYMIAG